MRTPCAPIALLAAVAALAPGCALHGERPVHGHTVVAVSAGGEKTARGELLAIDQDRIWLATKDGVRELERAAVREVRVPRGRQGHVVRKVGLIGGLVSTVALAVSCASVEGNGGGGCAAVGLVFGGTWALTGLLTGLSLDSSSRLNLSATDASLRAYARFPAGMPRGVAPEALVGPKPPRSLP